VYTGNERASKRGIIKNLAKDLPFAASFSLLAQAASRVRERRHKIMSTIHINPDEMQQLAGSFEWWCNHLREGMLPALQQLTSQLESDWQGESRQHYEELIHVWQRNAENLIDSAEDLSHHLMDTANRFEIIDNS
jgi:WXG100 family type VII secretion target